MKRAVLILGGIAALASIAAVAVSYFALLKVEREKNKKQTEAARAARWQKNGQDLSQVIDPLPSEDINRIE